MTSSDTITPLQRMISSCTGAVLTSLFVTPLDVVKVRLHTQLKSRCLVSCLVPSCCCVDSAPPHRLLTGTLDGVVHIARQEGVRALWSGLPPTMVMAVPGTVVYYTLYDQLRDQLAPASAGALARVMAATLVSPVEMLRTAMQSRKLSYLEVGRALRLQVRTKGLSSLYRGLVPTFWRDVPFSSIYWSVYEGLKTACGQQLQPSLPFTLLAGAVSGGVAAVATNPFDVVKTHQQVELSEGRRGSVRTMTGQLWQLYRSRGPAALFAGLSPRLLKVAPACAIMISSYELGKTFFRQRNSTSSLPQQ